MATAAATDGGSAWAEGTAAFRSGDLDAALAAFVPLADTHARAAYNVAAIHIRRGDFAAADIFYSAALAADPSLAVAHLQRGYICIAQKLYSRAARSYNMVLEILKDDDYMDYSQLGLKYRLYRCEALFNRAVCRELLGKHEQAMIDVADAQKLIRTSDHEAVIGAAAKSNFADPSLFTVPVDAIFNPSTPPKASVSTRNKHDVDISNAAIVTTNNHDYIPINTKVDAPRSGSPVPQPNPALDAYNSDGNNVAVLRQPHTRDSDDEVPTRSIPNSYGPPPQSSSKIQDDSPSYFRPRAELNPDWNDTMRSTTPPPRDYMNTTRTQLPSRSASLSRRRMDIRNAAMDSTSSKADSGPSAPPVPPLSAFPGRAYTLPTRGNHRRDINTDIDDVGNLSFQDKPMRENTMDFPANINGDRPERYHAMPLRRQNTYSHSRITNRPDAFTMSTNMCIKVHCEENTFTFSVHKNIRLSDLKTLICAKLDTTKFVSRLVYPDEDDPDMMISVVDDEDLMIAITCSRGMTIHLYCLPKLVSVGK